MFSFVILLLQFLNQVSDYLSAFVHKLYTHLSNVVFIVFDVYSVQSLLSGHLAIPRARVTG